MRCNIFIISDCDEFYGAVTFSWPEGYGNYSPHDHKCWKFTAAPGTVQLHGELICTLLFILTMRY